MADCITSYRRLTASAEIQRGPTDFYGIVVQSSQSGEQTHVYAAPDDNDMYLFDTYINKSKNREQFLLRYPVRFSEGLYVKLTGNVVSVLVLFKPVPTAVA